MKRPSRKPEDVAARNAIIVEAYRKNMPISEICALTGMTRGSIKVRAHRLGCSKSGEEVYDYRRGFSVPEALKDEYRALKAMGFRAREVAKLLGISVGGSAP